MKSAVTLVLVVLFVVTSAAVLAPMAVYTTPPTGVPTLDAHFCKATLHGTWTGKTRTCTIRTLVVDSSIGNFAIPSKTTLAIGAGGTEISFLTINSGVTITNYGVIDSGTMNNNVGGTIENYGTINNNVGGTILNDYSGTIINYGTINNKCFGTVQDYGTWVNYGSFCDCNQACV